MHNALYARKDVDRLYVSRKKGGKGLASIDDSVDVLIKRLEDDIEKNEGRLFPAIGNNTDNTMGNRMTIPTKQKWAEKQLYGRFKRLINAISHQKLLDVAKKRKPEERNRISLNSSTKQRHKNRSYQNDNRQDTTKVQM